MVLGLVAVLMWSTIATAFKLGLRDLTPIQLLWIGSCFSWMLFTACILVTPKPSLARNQVLGALLLGFINPVLYYVVLLYAYDLLPAHVAQPLNYTWAITTALLAIPLLGQKLSFRKFSGILLGYLGVLILVTGGNFTLDLKYDGFGVVLALTSTLIWALYWIYSVKIDLPASWFMWLSFTAATPVLTIVCLIAPGLPELSIWNLSTGAWIGLFEMGFAFLLWQRAMAITDSAANLSQLIFLSPLISLLFITNILQETIHASVFLALVLIMVGFLIVNRTVSTSSGKTTH